MKKILSLIIVFSILATCMLPVAYGAENSSPDASWNISFPSHGRMMPFRPVDEYVSVQNPPAFTYPLVEEATYDIIVCSDPELKNVVYSKEGINNNYYNFEYTFETGVHYWWAVRYVKGGKASGWSDARRFRIDPDAYEFPLEPLEDIFARLPKTHPRIYTTPDTLEEFRAIKDTNPVSKELYDKVVQLADRSMVNAANLHEPDGSFWSQNLPEVSNTPQHQAWRGDISAARSLALNCGFAYLLTGDEKYIEPTRLAMMEMTTWDFVNNTSYQHHDIEFRDITWQTAYALDWTYDKIPEEDRKKIIEMLRFNTQVMCDHLLDGIRKSPYDSHGWTAYGYIGNIAIVLYGEVPEAEEWIRSVLPTYIALLPPWSYQDGGWSQGPNYWTNSSEYNQRFMDVLKLSGMIDLYDTAWARNEYLWNVYVTPAGIHHTFGDATSAATVRLDSTGRTRNSISNQAYFMQNGVAKWLLEQQKTNWTSETDNYYVANMANLESTPPYSYPLAHEFKDIGWIVMTDDLISEDRIHLTFKSSPYGSYNHSHPDQNSFFIQAYGEILAGRNGFYDSYHSPHDSGFTRKTGAHNSVTVATNKGQADDDFNAKGHLTAFLNHVDFDLGAGDATRAYNGVLEGFNRSIIYVRPDIFIIIDDLDGKGTAQKTKFEWWLNAESGMEVYEDGTGVKITRGDAVLDTSVKYPQKVTTYFNNNYALSDMQEFKPGYAQKDSPSQERVWFETPEVDKTKMVVVLDVHRKSQNARNTRAEYFDGYMTLTLEDGTVCIVNLGDNTSTVDTGTVKFTGQSVIMNDNSIMLDHGTYLAANGKEVFKSEKVMSAVVGKNELGLSTYTDNRITVYTDNDYVSSIESVTDYDRRPIGKEYGIVMEDGALTENDDGTVTVADAKAKTFNVDKANYTLMLNGKYVESAKTSTNIDVYVDGNKVSTGAVEGYTRRDGVSVYSGTVEVPAGRYVIESVSEGLNLIGLQPGTKTILSELAVNTNAAEGNAIYLKTASSLELKEYEAINDYDGIKAQLTVFKEAEDVVSLSKGAAIYSTRQFLSGGAGVQLLNTSGQQAVYTITIPEDGVYDLVVKAVAWEGETKRIFSIADTDYVVPIAPTSSWGTAPEQWVATKADIGVELKAGEYTVSIEPHTLSWNYDWFGFIKR